MKYIDWFKDIAENMNDAEEGFEFTRYTLRSMIRAYNDAMCLVAKYRPDLFTEYRKVKLEAGRYQDVRGCCSNVLEVLEQLDANGNIVKTLTGSRATRNRNKTVWRKPSCLNSAAPGEYVIDNAWIDKNMNGRFTVDPPLPCDVEAWALVKCVSQPCPLVHAKINENVKTSCEHMVATKHYILAWLLSGDRFANGANARSREQYTLFFEILGVVQRQEDRIESTEQA